MKKIMSLIFAFLLMFMLSACSSGNQEIGDTQEQEEVSNGNSQIETSNESEENEDVREEENEDVWEEENFFTVSGRPMEVSSGRIILQDETNQQYGLYDSTGEEILPCEYGDMKFISVNSYYEPKVYVAIQDKGSYGLYDLDGTEIIAPMYDDIMYGATYTDHIIVKRSGQYVDQYWYGVADLEGNEIIPTEYKIIESCSQGMFGALNQEGMTSNSFTLDIYDFDGNLNNSFPVEGLSWSDRETTVRFMNRGTLISIQNVSTQSTVYTHVYDLQGTEQNNTYGGFSQNFFTSYVDANTNTLYIINELTNEEVLSYELPYENAIINGSPKLDAGNGNVTGVITIYYYKDDSFRELSMSTKYLVNLGENSSITMIEGVEDVGPFYQGTAFASSDESLYVIDTLGNKTELSVRFSTGGSSLFTDCAILNNNGYIYVIDKNGNTIHSEDGYVQMDEICGGEGLIQLTASDGSIQVIDRYGNEIIPLGGTFVETALYGEDGEEIDGYALIYNVTDDTYYFVDSENGSVLDITDETDGSIVEQLLDGEPYVLLDEVEGNLIAITYGGDCYQIYEVLKMKE